MILELLEYFLTPTSSLARSMGFLKSSLQVKARHSRCKKDWLPHLENTRACIRQATQMCPKHQKVILLGAGLLHDVPLQELSVLFEKVILVDVIHPLSTRLSARRFPNVSCLSWDVTEIMSLVPTLRREPSTPLPVSFPQKFTDDQEVDLVISLNLLSQLPWVPSQYLASSHPESQLEPFLQHLIRAHLDYLQRLPCHTALITDFAWAQQPTKGGPRKEWDVLRGIQLPPPTEQWEWNIAPAPEREADLDFTTKVAAYPDWKSSSAGRHWLSP